MAKTLETADGQTVGEIKEVVMVEKIELDRREKEMLIRYNNAVKAAQASLGAFLTGIAVAKNIPEDYQWDPRGLCWIKSPEKKG